MRFRVHATYGLALLAGAAILFVVVKFALAPALGWLAAHRDRASVPFILVYILTAIALLPDSLLTLAAGAIFGLVRGFVLVSIGSTLGATVAFFIGRTLARGWIERRSAGWPKFHALERATARHGFWIVLLTRLSPLIPFGLLNYAYSITAVRPRDYLLASWIGMLPGGLLYVYVGTAAANLSAVLRGRTEAGRPGELLLWTGLAATILLVVLLTHFVRRELARELHP